jgi:hypothetical protein
MYSGSSIIISEDNVPSKSPGTTNTKKLQHIRTVQSPVPRHFLTIITLFLFHQGIRGTRNVGDVAAWNNTGSDRCTRGVVQIAQIIFRQNDLYTVRYVKIVSTK